MALADALTATGARCKVLPINSGDVLLRHGQQATVSACSLSKEDTLCVALLDHNLDVSDHAAKLRPSFEP